MRLLIFTICSAIMLAGCSAERSSVKTDACTTNLTAIWRELKIWDWNGDSLPSSFAQLPLTNNPALFVCPDSGHSVGAMSNVVQWTDYIHVTGPPESMMLDVAVLICPPENHNGEFGHVIFGDGAKMIRLPAEKVRALVKEPWSMPSSARNSIRIYGSDGKTIPFAEQMRTTTTIHIPERLRSVYTQDAK
jgi:hypothetical protein